MTDQTKDKVRAAFRYWFQRGCKPAIALDRARVDLANGVARYPRPMPSATGRNLKRYGNPFVETPEEIGARLVGYADEIAGRSIDHKGWFNRFDDQDSTYRGAVLQLPSHKGKIRLLAGYQESDNDGFIIDLSRGALFEERADSDSVRDLDAARDAARRADDFARIQAEEARDYDTAWQAGAAFERKGEDIKSARVAALAILVERRKLKADAADAPTLCNVITAKVRDLLEEIAEAREEREKLKAGDADPYYFWADKPEHVQAFNEGAGEIILT